MERLKLDLIKKTLKGEDNTFSFIFDNWTFHPSERRTKAYFHLGDLTIDKDLISTVVFEKEEEIVTFEADYDGEGYFQNIMFNNALKYNEDLLLKELDLFLDMYVYKNPLTGGKGTVQGEAKVYYDYDQEEFVIELNKLVLEEN